MIKLVLVRHGQSIWNQENKFTGWTDVELSINGILEAKEAGKLLLENNFKFDIAYTSYLKRAIDTLNLIIETANYKNLKIRYTWKLNERHYGALQGLNKQETALKYGDEQVRIWRRSYSVKPPTLDEFDKRNPKCDPKYKNIDYLPLTESLEDTYKRVVDYYKNEIERELKNNKNILISAHGNSLRALIKYLENISDDDIVSLEIPTGRPYVYELDDNLSIIKKYYL